MSTKGRGLNTTSPKASSPPISKSRSRAAGAPAFEVAFQWGQYYVAVCDYERAQEELGRARNIAREHYQLVNEAASLTQLGLVAYRCGRYALAQRWFEQAQRAFDWFLGWNDLGLELYAPTTGGCRDALHVDRVNQNQGSESTLAFLLSLAEMQLAQNDATVLIPPVT